jgi:Mg/Co/Ni transporter MgtE
MSEEGKKFSEELVKDAEKLIVSDPASVETGTDVFTAVEAVLKEPRTKSVYVLDERQKLIGLITVHELLKVSSIQVGAHKRKRFLGFFKYMNLLYSETVDEVMRNPCSVRMDDKLIHALQLMEEFSLLDIPVVDGNDRLIGELSGLEVLTVLRDKIKSGEIEKLK